MNIKVNEEIGRSAAMSYNEKKGDSRAFKKMVNRWRKLNGLDPLYKEKPQSTGIDQGKKNIT